jgi:hypothetical protein
MYTTADKCQVQAWLIKEGRHQQATIYREIMEWISAEFGVRALDFFCETRQKSKGSAQQLVHIILEDVEEVKQMQSDRSASASVIERFQTYFKSADSHNGLDVVKSDVFPLDTTPFPRTVVTYRPLDVSSNALNKMMDEEQRAILKTYETVWTISMNVIFYYTVEQVKENLANGTSKRIIEELAMVTRKYGFEPGSPYRFDSKEVFDEDAKGDWYLYWK